MVRVQLQDGTQIEFAKTPTPADVDFAYKKVQEEKARKASIASTTTPIKNEGFGAGVTEKIADFTGGKEIGQGLGQALAQPKNAKQLSDAQDDATKIQGALLTKIKEKKALGEDTARLEGALQDLGFNIEEIGTEMESNLNPNKLTTKEVVGDAIQTGATIASFGTYGAGAKGAVALPTVLDKTIKSAGTIKGAIQGAKTGAIVGTSEGAVQGFAQGLQENESGTDLLKSAGEGAVIGGAGGLIVGGALGSVTGTFKGKKINDAVIDAQEKSGVRPTLQNTIVEKSKTNPEFRNLVKEATKQGYSEKEINFLSTVSDVDKPTLKKMFDYTAKAQVDPRQTVRAGDILGDNATAIVKQIEDQNKQFGKAVDTTAKALKGKTVDATPVKNKAVQLLENAGVVFKGGDTSGLGLGDYLEKATINSDDAFDWSKSIFKKTPEIQNKIVKALSDLPDGEWDAYDVHQFKKSIDEIVEYGVSGEGMKGKSATLLKGIRAEADNVLDTNFEEYNTANTEFKATRDILDEVRDVVGDKVDFSTKASGQAFGQKFRSAFSNNASRGRTLQLIETLQDIAKKRKLKGAEQNLLDQALYVNMLEDKFGSEASTGLASEVRKGVEKAKKGIQALRNPIEGVGNLAVDIYEKSRNINDEAKKDILQKFLK